MIPLFKVFLPPNLGASLQEVFDSGFVSEGSYSDLFEKTFGDFLKNNNCSLVNSCTSALTLAYRMADVGPGKVVITTPFTCMATNEPIQTMGADIVWADIEVETGNICPISVENLVKKHGEAIAAVVGVHWAGNPFAVQKIRSILDNYGLHHVPVIEDAAHALGSKHSDGTIVGATGDYVCFSFQAIKHMTTVDGGAILTNNASSNARIKKLKWFGLDRKFLGSKWTQDITESGYKFHMNNVNAKIGLEQMKFLEDNIEKHYQNGKFYDENLQNPLVKPLKVNPSAKSSYWIYTVLVDDRQRFQDYLTKNGISSDVVHVRNDKYSVFSKYQTELPGVDYFCDRHINIPVGWWLTNAERHYIIDTVNAYR